jgi:hypothetical protein
MLGTQTEPRNADRTQTESHIVGTQTETPNADRTQTESQSACTQTNANRALTAGT